VPLAVAAPSFARTKIQPPRLRPGALIARPNLEARLRDALLNERLVLVCAGAGYGKTAALARQIDALPAGTALAWVSLDDGDDLPRLLDCLVAALEPYDPPWRVAPEALVAGAGDAPRAERRALAEELINTLDACDVPHGVIVLDDLHRVADRAVTEFLDLLLARFTPRWTLAIASRSEPPLALARLRVAAEVAEFRQRDLAFNRAEIGALVGDGSDSERVQRLARRTEGWPAGLRLCLAAADRGDASAPAASRAAERHLFDYLASEVVGGMPPALRDFLVRSSVLPELSAARCAAVTGNPRAAELLDEVERRGLFVSVLNEAGGERTLRLHDLLRELLEQQLQRDHADELPALLKQAAAGETDPRRRLELLRRAQAWDDAERVLAEATPALLAAGDSAQVLRLLEGFPPQRRQHSPLLAFVRGLAAWPRFEWITMNAALERAAAGFAAAGLEALARRARVYRILSLAGCGRLDDGWHEFEALRGQPLDDDLRAHLALMPYWLTGARGPAEGPAQHLEGMLRVLEGHRDPALWYRCAPHFLLIGRPGLRAPLQRYIDGALALAGDAHVPLRAAAQALSAWCKLWHGDIAAADAAMEAAKADDRWLGGQRSLHVPVLAYGAARAAIAGDTLALLQHGRAMIDDVAADSERRPTWRGMYLFMIGRVAAACDDWSSARAIDDELQAAQSSTEWPIVGVGRRLMVAWLAWHDGRIAARDVAVTLTSLAVEAGAVDSFGCETTVRLLAARAWLDAADAAAAAAVLRPAIVRLRLAGEVAGAWLTGRTTLRALAEAPWGHALESAELALLRDWHARLVALSPSPTARSAPGAGGATAAANGALSAREQEVLARIAAGDSNKLIARALDLSPHTVKRHVANILDKLDLRTRGQAAAWHRQVGGPVR
jgi:LuxR family maltose regulon positive regulatory protein